ncbi:hypothetical protein [Flavobacterium sp. I3-2]|uniref:hypothetical protein n=1 Tax=Flavobacterium sp. I3-2 TaxID=2748319 RepID=UPI0015AF21DF|nr:hypothetical protein [Flavobacterium sp. I3-2]
MLFTEKQYFKQIWLWAIILITTPISILPIVNSSEVNLVSLLICLVPTLLIIILFLVMNLKTSINQKSIDIQFFPFIRKPKSFLWDDIQKIELKKYQPLVEYGGWGIRGLGDDKAYNIKGNIGLKLFLKNGKKVMIGTQNPKNLNKVIAEICKSQKIPFHNSLTE